MTKFDYNRIRKSFIAGSENKTPESKRNEISYNINKLLDSYGSDGWNLVFYNELLIEEGTVHITAVFKKELISKKIL